MRNRWPAWAPALVIVVVGIAAFAGGLYSPFLFDDRDNVLENPQVHDWWGASGGRSTPLTGRPVAAISFALNYALAGPQPASFRATNIAIHIFAGLFLFGIVRRTLQRDSLRTRFGRDATPLALACSLLWLVHPMQTESVTYISQRIEALMGMFYLATVYCAVRALEADGGRQRSSWTAVAMIASALGMATKEVMVTAPLMVFLYDLAFVSRGSVKRAWRDHRALHLGLLSTWLVLLALPHPHAKTNAKAVPLRASYLYSQAPVILSYLRTALWPRTLIFDYGPMTMLSLGDVPLELAGLTALLTLVAIAWWYRPQIGFLGVWFFAILLPTSSVFVISAEVGAERRVYLSLAALSVLVVIGGYRGLTACSRRLKWSDGALTIPVLSLVLLALFTLTWQRNLLFRDPLDVWRAAVAATPGNPRAHLNYAEALIARGDKAGGERHLRRALAISPNYGRAAYGLGCLQLERGELREARASYERALLASRPDGYPHYGLGVIDSLEGDDAGAASNYRRALEIDPKLTEAALNLAWLLVTASPPQVPEAAALAERLIDEGGEQPALLDLLAATRAAEGRWDDAAKLATRARQLAVQAGDGELTAKIDRHLESYRQQRRLTR